MLSRRRIELMHTDGQCDSGVKNIKNPTTLTPLLVNIDATFVAIFRIKTKKNVLLSLYLCLVINLPLGSLFIVMFIFMKNFIKSTISKPDQLSCDPLNVSLHHAYVSLHLLNRRQINITSLIFSMTA